MIKTRPVRGTEDKLDIRLERTLEKTLVNKMLMNNFSQIQTPIIENLDLFVRCVGQDTDVVGKEMFLIESSSDDKLCLRPEATASTFRAYLNEKIQTRPWKVFSSGPMFRHERPQKGRWRQFDQFNIEVIDAGNYQHDVMLIELLDRTFKRDFGLQDFLVHINFLGNSKERAAHRTELVSFLEKQSSHLCQRCNERTTTNPLRCFDCKNEGCQTALESAPVLESFLEPESEQEWKAIQNELTLMDVNFVKDQKLVRGLDYYNGVVFEFKSNLLGAQDTFCAGGRYDLAQAFGLKNSVSSIGAAAGIGRLALILEQAGLLPKIEEQKLNLVIPMEQDQRVMAMMLAREISEAGLCADVMLESCSFSNMMKKANKTGASKVLILGKTEQESNTVVVKDMINGEQETVQQNQVLAKLS